MSQEMTTTQTELNANLAITKQSEAQAKKLDELARMGAGLATVADPSFSEGLKMAATIKSMRESLTPAMMAPVMELMNTPLGFRTDRDPSQIDRKTGKPMKPYSLDVVKEATIEAMMRGVPPINNCFNIIAGRCYLTKEGFSFLLRNKVDGLTNLETCFSVPKMKDGGAIVECSASWQMHGKPQSLKREIAIKVNAMMGVDAITGKATRKLLAAVYAQATGTELSDGEAEAVTMRDVTSKAENPLTAMSAAEQAGKEGLN